MARGRRTAAGATTTRQPHPTASVEADVDRLHTLLRDRRVVVLAGAGCSTESGIPDYRGPEGRLRSRAPIQYREFVRSADGRARYWARSVVGWPRFAAAAPNDGHRALARLEDAGAVRGVITQNVDGLHQAAGSRRVIEPGVIASPRPVTARSRPSAACYATAGFPVTGSRTGCWR